MYQLHDLLCPLWQQLKPPQGQVGQFFVFLVWPRHFSHSCGYLRSDGNNLLIRSKLQHDFFLHIYHVKLSLFSLWNISLGFKSRTNEQGCHIDINCSDGYTKKICFTIVCEIHFYLPFHNNVLTILFIYLFVGH